MKAHMMISLPLSDCYLCECGCVGNNAMRCPACANEHGLLPLATVLDRDDSRAEPGLAHGAEPAGGRVGA
jgi:hypothetical protein